MSEAPASGEHEGPSERIDRLVREGLMPHSAVTKAEQLWREHLQDLIPLPNGDSARVTIADLYHVIVDARIWRKPERIESILRNVFEIRGAKQGRRRALSRWQEGDQTLLGFAILDLNGTVRSLHVVEERDLRKLQRKETLLWKL